MARTAGRERAPRVVLLARNLLIGGAERVFVTLANNAQRVSVHPVLLRRYGGLLDELDDRMTLRSLDARVAGAISADGLTELPGGSVTQLAIECRRLIRIVDELRIDVVSSFLMRSHLVALLVKTVARPRLRVVLNVHEHMTESEPYLYPGRLDRAAARLVTRRLFRRADRIVTVADELRRDLVERFGLPSALVQTLHNPVDVDRIRALGAVDRALDAPGDGRPPLICAIGRLVHLKGYDVLLRAVAELRRSVRVRVALVGDGEERGALEELARSLGIADDVRFVGWQSNPWRFLGRSSLLALSSRTEAFPNVLTEAMALDVPVVAAECSRGIRDCLDDGRAGLLVRPEDPGALDTALRRVLTEPALAERLRAAGRRRVARFGLRETVRAYESMLLDVSRPTLQVD